MNILETVKLYIKNAIRFSKLYPYFFFGIHPLKLYELKELLAGIDVNKNQTYLDLGCGYGFQMPFLKRKCDKLIGIEPSQEVISSAQKNQIKGEISFICGDLTGAKIREGTIDKVFSFCVIEHIPDYMDVFREIYRILKEGGQFIFSVDSLEVIADQEILNKHGKLYSVFHYFTKKNLEESLKRAGFRNLQVYPILKTPFAVRFFSERVRNDNWCGDIENTWRGHRKDTWRGHLVDYLRLVYGDRGKEYQAKQKGILLIAKCQK